MRENTTEEKQNQWHYVGREREKKKQEKELNQILEFRGLW
jgi:hypothetical protein